MFSLPLSIKGRAGEGLNNNGRSIKGWASERLRRKQ